MASDLQAEIMVLVQKRGPDKTICPSEAARAFADGDNWRQWMEPVLKAARALHQENKIQIEQQGQPVDPDAITGPIRLRLKEGYNSANSRLWNKKSETQVKQENERILQKHVKPRS